MQASKLRGKKFVQGVPKAHWLGQGQYRLEKGFIRILNISHRHAMASHVSSPYWRGAPLLDFALMVSHPFQPQPYLVTNM